MRNNMVKKRREILEIYKKGAVRLKNVSCVPINCIKEVTESLDSSFDQSNMLIIKKMDTFFKGKA